MRCEGAPTWTKSAKILSVCICVPPVVDGVQALGPDRTRNQGSDLSSRPKRPALCSPSGLALATTTAVLFSADLQRSCRLWFTLL